MKDLSKKQDLANSCDSAGISNYHVGEKPDYRSITIASNYGIDISAQRAREFQYEDFQDFDYIFAMDTYVYTSLKKMNASYSTLYLMREFDPIKDDKDVPDPYYGQLIDFDKVYQIIDRSCKHFLETINNGN
jgi:protein-tyrosine phosphatase